MPSRPAARVIEGRHHPLVKQLRSLVRSGELLSDGLVLLETVRLIEDAVSSGISIEKVFISRPASAHARDIIEMLPSDTVVYEIAADVFQSLATTETNQGIVALAAAPEWREQDLFPHDAALVVVVVGVQDPGNLGTIIRTAEAFGSTGIVLTRGTVSPYNAKVVRSTAGSLLRMPLLRDVSVSKCLAMLRRHGVRLYTGVVEGGSAITDIAFAGSIALAVGSEGAGLPAELAAAGGRFTISIAPAVESLNVAAATAIVLYEIARWRQKDQTKSADCADNADEQTREKRVGKEGAF